MKKFRGHFHDRGSCIGTCMYPFLAMASSGHAFQTDKLRTLFGIVYAYFGLLLGDPREPRQLKPSGEPLQVKAFSTIKPLSIRLTGGSVPLLGIFPLFDCRRVPGCSYLLL